MKTMKKYMQRCLKYMNLVEFLQQWMTLSEIILDSSILNVILLTNLICLPPKLEVPTLNTKWAFMHALDFKEMATKSLKISKG